MKSQRTFYLWEGFTGRRYINTYPSESSIHGLRLALETNCSRGFVPAGLGQLTMQRIVQQGDATALPRCAVLRLCREANVKVVIPR